MPSPIVSATIQACVLSATSNIIAQFITIYKTNALYTINWMPVIHFILFTALNSPPNFLWQSFLEASFPSTHPVPSKAALHAAASNNEKELDREQSSAEILEPKLSVTNTLIKFFLDQSIGAVANTLLFSLFFAGVRGDTVQQAWATAREELWPLMGAGWKLWPAVSAFNFGVVRSVQARSLVGNIAGLGWGVYLSLVTG